jgi:hypothetical protein
MAEIVEHFERIVKPMPPEMKEALKRKKEIAEIRERVHPTSVFRTKFSEPPRNVVMVPDDYTGSDLKKAKRLIAKRMKEENKSLKRN